MIRGTTFLQCQMSFTFLEVGPNENGDRYSLCVKKEQVSLCFVVFFPCTSLGCPFP